ncbi:methyltransferase domain-containing protein [Candidatus Magnetominusculus dajiuhuensis]|uniref:methyltransferase domain-containing protein n=1 Tax=Candidatus Magnetominusculus dajiuhuensis TaxID=3137712 RepID=UPI003B42B34F
MHRNWLDKLVCHQCKTPLLLHDEIETDGLIETGTLSCITCKKDFAIRGGIPRFVTLDAEYENFGVQWNKFRRTQIDSLSGLTQSEDRFFRETDFKKNQIGNKLFLDAGCGAGRFADIVLKYGGEVICVDISNAVDACKENLIALGYDIRKFLIVQASIYELPFCDGTFDRIYSLGVIQHMPDRQKSIECLSEKLSKSGKLAIWVYEKNIFQLFMYKYYFRILTKHLSWKINYRISVILTDIFFPFGNLLHKFKLTFFTRFLPFAFRAAGDYEVSKEWSLLDTFDSLSPRYDNPLTFNNCKTWFKKAGLTDVRRLNARGLSVVGTKDSA